MPSTRPPIYRLLVIDREIRSGRFPNAPGLARKLEVSSRTIQRDIEFLRDSLNAPLEWSVPDNGYRYSEPSFFLPYHQVTEGELLAVLVADKALTEFEGTPFQGTLRSIFEKLAEALPEEITVSPRELAEAYSFRRTAPVRDDSRIFRMLQEAIQEAESLEVYYHTQSRGETRWRRIAPYHLANVDGEWYLLAFCHRHGEVRVFRPSRVRECRRSGETFEPKSDFDPARFLKTKFQAMAGEEPVEIRVRFDKTLAGYITERQWGPTHRVQFLTDGGVDLTLTTENVDAVLRWVLNWGIGAEVLAPKWARQRMRQTLQRLSETYATRPPAQAATTPRRSARRGSAPPASGAPAPVTGVAAPLLESPKTTE